MQQITANRKSLKSRLHRTGMQPSLHVRNLLETDVLHLQHSPGLDEEVRWIQQFAMHLIAEFSVLKETGIPRIPIEDETPV
jgi:hypothetical protein